MGFDTRLTRKQFLTTAVLGAAAAAVGQEPPKPPAGVKEAAEFAGLGLNEDQLKAVAPLAGQLAKSIGDLRKVPMPNELGPAFVFRPEGRAASREPGQRLPRHPAGFRPEAADAANALDYGLREIRAMLDSGAVTSRELTEQSLARLKRYAPKLLCAVTLLEERALAKADAADRRRAQGRTASPLDGIPCGIKDLFALRGHPTTWGAEPFKDQVLDYDAAVVEKLDRAGAVIVAKLTLGALAMDDKWFGGMTRNPWDPKQGSSGSSAGSASAMAARLVAFTVGTETLGSIVSPSQRCRVTGLRPTFGRVSRHGAMALSWTMDKVGPICRSAEDCALVLEALNGADPRDPMSTGRPFAPRQLKDLKGLRIAYLSAKPLDEDDSGGALEPVLETLRSLGADPKPAVFRPIPNGTDELLACEAAAAFQQITLDGRVDTLQRSFWPQIFRTAHLMSGVDYVQAMRARTLVMRQFEEDFGDFDLLVAPDRGGFTLYNTNLAGHPQVYVPNGGRSGFSLVGRLYGEATLCAVAQRFQDAAKHYLAKPDMAALDRFEP